MFVFFRLLLVLMIFILFVSCNEKILYSGKILYEENFDYAKLRNKEEVIDKLGNPNFIDPIEKKYYYFSEKKYVKNFFHQKISNRIMVVFIFNENETIKSVSQYDLNDEQVYYLINTEPPKVIALALDQLSQERKIKIMDRFGPDMKHNVIMELGKLNEIPLEGVVNVAKELVEQNLNP